MDTKDNIGYEGVMHLGYIYYGKSYIYHFLCFSWYYIIYYWGVQTHRGGLAAFCCTTTTCILFCRPGHNLATLTVCRLPFDLMHTGELALGCCGQHIAHSCRHHGWFKYWTGLLSCCCWVVCADCGRWADWLGLRDSCPVTLGAWLRSLGMTRHASKAACLKIAIEKLIKQSHRVSSSRYTTSFFLPHDAHDTWRRMAPMGCLWAAAIE